MERNICIILCLLFINAGCTHLPSFSRKISDKFDSSLINEINVTLSSEIQKGIGEIVLKKAVVLGAESPLPVFSIETKTAFNAGGRISIEIPIIKELLSTLYSGDLQNLTLCTYNFKNENWEKISTQFDSSTSTLKAEIDSLKKDNLDKTLSKILISLSFPAKDGLITNLYQKNKLVESQQGSIDNFFNSSSNKNCIIIHGVSSNPKNMLELYKTIENLNYYENIIFYQYASGDSIQKNSQWLVDQVNLNYAVQFDIIAHSMGGLVARYAVEQLGLDKNVNKLIMIGTPNNGGNFTEFAPVLFPKQLKHL